MPSILSTLQSDRAENIKSVALLIDPDKAEESHLKDLLNIASQTSVVRYIFLGGSLLTSHKIEDSISYIRENSDCPVILFPGDLMQINPSADAILFLSLISGRNPEYLIGKQVLAAPILKKSNLEVLPTGYILVNSGRETTVSYVSNTKPIPSNKPDIAGCTAMAGEMLGLKIMYLDAGSGADNPIPEETIRKVRQCVETPIIIGGGIISPDKVLKNFEAGADVVVIGNAAEKNPQILIDIDQAIAQAKLC